jgi:hypothetical protein
MITRPRSSANGDHRGVAAVRPRYPVVTLFEGREHVESIIASSMG